jgi:hypothetical protein
VVFLGEETANYLRDEDNFIENLGAISFLIASILYLASYLQSGGSGNIASPIESKNNKFYLLFAIIFFIGFGEEISWGQRLIGWDTPQLFIEINKQNETNIHNSWVFHRKIFGLDKLFFIFWFSYCLILPLVTKYSLEARRYISRFDLPVPPLWIGFLLVTNFSIYLIPQFFPSDWPQTHYIDRAFLEIMESNDALIFAVLAFHELKKQLSIKKRRLVKEGG